jgi:hypothetical protein
MVPPEIENTTPFTADVLFLCDESYRPVATPIVKATYAIGRGRELMLAEQQRPIELKGTHHGEPGTSSLREEPEVAFVKEATDVVLIGHAVAPHPGCSELDVSLSVGPIQKTVSVIGDRIWEKGLAGMRIGPSAPFERIPLIWERAFGGWDETPTREKRRAFEPRNPVGVGFHARQSQLDSGTPLPNLEDPGQRIKRWGSQPRPAGFGFIAPNWEPRAALAGTYDESWETGRSPRLPMDFRRRHFNAAPEDQIVDGYLPGDARVEVTHVTPDGRLVFDLPGLASPTAVVSRRNGRPETLALALDTVVIDTDAMRVSLLWRQHTLLRNGPFDVRSVRIACANSPERPRIATAPANVVPLFPSSSGSVARTPGA